ncbi:hypothetical protein [Alteromonas phage PB15]|nr:hypothetical protein [Alteromonas phage PB15]
MDPVTIGSLIGVGKELISRVWPDPQDQAEELRKLEELRQKGELAELQAYIQVMQARLSVIQAEATSEHFLTSNWRPIVMLVFTGLIVARWFGLSAEGITEREYIEIWEILKLGIGGYVVGRSAEKVMKEYKKK